MAAISPRSPVLANRTQRVQNYAIVSGSLAAFGSEVAEGGANKAIQTDPAAEGR
jgi:hypothetical protein